MRLRLIGKVLLPDLRAQQATWNQSRSQLPPSLLVVAASQQQAQLRDERKLELGVLGVVGPLLRPLHANETGLTSGRGGATVVQERISRATAARCSQPGIGSAPALRPLSRPMLLVCWVQRQWVAQGSTRQLFGWLRHSLRLCARDRSISLGADRGAGGGGAAQGSIEAWQRVFVTLRGSQPWRQALPRSITAPP